MIEDNVQLTRFLDTVRGEGFDLLLNWQVRRYRGDVGSVRHYSVMNGPGGRIPALRTFVIVDYGPRDGYSLYGEEQSNKITDDVAAVIGVPADEVSIVF